MAKLGKLVEVPLREVWKNEERDFSSWLAEPENLNELGNILGLSLTDIEREKHVGVFESDIVCKDEVSGETVVIENQLEATNHDHLGKIITYASGLDAAVVVWIVSKAKPEHASAIQWLNTHTDDSLSFFLIEIKAYKIGNSEPAPQFNVVEQPNDFVRNSKKERNSFERNNARKAEQLAFWEQFNDVIEERGRPFNTRSPRPQHWYNVAAGSSDCHISVTLVNSENKMGVELYIPRKKELYNSLFEHKEQIESAIGHELVWMPLEDKLASRVVTYFSGLDFDHKENYRELMDKAINEVVLFLKGFKPFLK